MSKELILSYSKIDSLLDCEGIFYWKYLRELERIQWKMEYLLGNARQESVYLLMSKDEDAEEKVLKFFDKEVHKLRKDFSISTRDEQGLVESRIVLKAMHKAYAKQYAKDLKIEKHVANESDSTYEVPGLRNVLIRIKLDNIIDINSKWYLHEGKAWKYLNPEVVNNVRNNFQIALYFYIHNLQFKFGKIPRLKIGKKEIKSKPFSGIIFDAIMKPSIRKKQGETYRGYLKRLERYYESVDSGNKFYKEVFDEPGLRQKDIIYTIEQSSKRMQKIQEGRLPMLSYKKCSWCDYKEICLGGEIPQNLAFYKRRKNVTNKANQR